jgi:hypothetical protein
MGLEVLALGGSLFRWDSGPFWSQAREPRGTHITGQLLIVFHELFVLLVHRQHLADAIGCSFRLATGQRKS